MAWEVWIQFIVVGVLLVFGFTIGSVVERAHFRRLKVREKAVRDILLTDLKALPALCAADSCTMVFGEVVIASDYFKTFVSGLRKIVGGELRAYETLMERARREAILRMVESAKQLGANAVYNIRFSSTNIGSIRRKRAAAMVEMYAYGTAIKISESKAGSATS